MGTLYTSAYHLAERRVDFLWPGFAWSQSFEAFEERARTVTLVDASAAA
jgi:hypothetical protein